MRTWPKSVEVGTDELDVRLTTPRAQLWARQYNGMLPSNCTCGEPEEYDVWVTLGNAELPRVNLCRDCLISLTRSLESVTL